MCDHYKDSGWEVGSSVKARLALAVLCFVIASPSQRKEFERPARHAARGTRGAVGWQAVNSPRRPACEPYYAGGNAVDAGVAAMFAASVTEFSHFGFGGEAPILIRTAAGKVWAIAGVGTMPKLATADLFRQRPLKSFEVMEVDPGGLKGMVPVAGIMPALVPGMVDAGLVALREFGTKSFAEIIQPAIELADGAPLDEMRAGAIARSRRFFEAWPDSKRVFAPNGVMRVPGEIFRQPDLARTLRSMADAEKKALAAGKDRKAAIDAVRDHFYRGDIARTHRRVHEGNGGLLRYEDMAAFQLRAGRACLDHISRVQGVQAGVLVARVLP